MDIFEEMLGIDKIYSKDISDARKLEEKYRALQLTKQQQMIIDDYIACLLTAMDRKCKIAYVCGFLKSDDARF